MKKYDIFEEGFDDRVIEIVKTIIKQNEQYAVLPESELRFEEFVPNELDSSKGHLVFSHYIDNQRQKDLVLFEKDKYDTLSRIIHNMERFRH